MSEAGEAGEAGTRLLRPGVARVLGGLTLVAVAVLCLFGLWGAPPDDVQSDAQRLMYLHVPAAWVAYLAFGVTALGSVMYLWKRTRSLTWDRVAGASAEIGVVFTAVGLVTGMIWGHLSWGVYWTWDARLTTTALLFVLFLGYLALRRMPAEPHVRAKRAAILGIIAFIDVPIVHQSVEWWRTLHQDATVLRRDLDVQVDGIMLFTLFLGFVVFSSIYAWLLLHRHRVAVMEDALDEHGLELAIEERRAEGVATP
jgi:heme exporter protein C